MMEGGSMAGMRYLGGSVLVRMYVFDGANCVAFDAANNEMALELSQSGPG
jgi:hypothetical protein